MATIKRFEDLEVWQLARDQAKKIYHLATGIDKKFAAQINAAAGSVMDNIAEGFDRHTTKDFIHFLLISRGSNAEVRSQVIRGFDQGLFSELDFESAMRQSEVIGRKLTAFIKYLRNCKYPAKPG